MKTATVRDLRNSFARVSRWLEAGETVEVTKRGRVFARILPAAPPKAKRAPKPDILARLRADFGGFVLSDKACDEIMREAKASHVERLS
jgi:antitoxin (DNA-binding transcriptional repressor) of toxin-antitoxin stability system